MVYIRNALRRAFQEDVREEMDMEELVGFCGSLRGAEKKSLGTAVKRRGKVKTYELVINPTNDSLNSRTQHLVQPDVPIIHSSRDHLRIHHISPSQHPSDPPLSTNVLSQSVRVEGVRGYVRVVGTRIYVWTRVEEC